MMSLKHKQWNEYDTKPLTPVKRQNAIATINAKADEQNV